MNNLLTTKEVAEILRIDEETVRVYARKGIIRSIKLGNKIRFRQPVVENFITASEVKLDGQVPPIPLDK